ncbi:MAG: D-2-hydroxyacid dehydrogenase [Saprospiraceae bacterium]|nr:D-2-hydroxyacid dehydrogenase [Saprospiraceae bacterium]
MNIVFLDAYTLNPGDLSFSGLEALGNFKAYDRSESKDLQSRMKNVEVAIVNKFPVNEKTLNLMPDLKYIVVAATGYNNIDIETVKRKNIPVSNVKGYSTEGVAQHVFASIMTLFNRIAYYDEKVKYGEWSTCPDFCFYHHSIQELSGLTMGIIGYGDIGSRVGGIAHAFGMKVLASTRNQDKPKPDFIKFSDQNIIFKNADIITLHVPLSEETKEIINRNSLSTMKKNAILVNTARGPLINESDLLDALNEKTISGAVLDVLSKEPPENDNPLLKHPTVLITPHIAWAGLQSRQRLLNGLIENISQYQKGEILNRVV